MDWLGSIDHSVLAFYGVNPEAGAIESVFNASLDWMSRFDCVPDLMGNNYEKSKYVPFSKSRKKLIAKGFDSLSHFEICALADHANTTSEGIMAEIYCNIKESRKVLVIDCQTDKASLVSSKHLEIAREACALSSPSYGIGYRRKAGLGPTLFALCISYGPKTEGLQISRWGEAVRFALFDCGLLRDVYSWNFLTAPQLARPVGNADLENWIRDDPRRGSLVDLTDKVTLWEVLEEDIPDIRKALFDADVIFDYDKHIQKPLHLFKVVLQPGDEARDFFQAWVTKTLDEMIEWYRQRYGCNPPQANRMTGEQVVANLPHAAGVLRKTRKSSRSKGSANFGKMRSKKRRE